MTGWIAFNLGGEIISEMKSKEISLPKLKAGGIVRVRPAESIRRSLDNFNKADGCLFMNQMWEYCGQEYKVLKVVNNFFDEYRYKMYKTRSPLCILDGIICSGITDEFQHRCDRSCYLLWHEKWLEKP